MRCKEHRIRILRVLPALLLFGAVAACGGDDNSAGETQLSIPTEAPASSDQGSVGTTEASFDGFTFAEDDLCRWITAAEVAGFFTSVYDSDVEAELVPDKGDTMGPDECHWRLTSATDDGFYEVSAGNGVNLPLLPVDEIVEYDGGTVGTPGGTVSGHPALSEGVVVQSEGWGIYAFWVPPRDDCLSLFVNHTTNGVTTGVDSATDEQGLMERQTQFFAFADQFISDLGWVS